MQTFREGDGGRLPLTRLGTYMQSVFGTALRYNVTQQPRQPQLLSDAAYVFCAWLMPLELRNHKLMLPGACP